MENLTLYMYSYDTSKNLNPFSTVEVEIEKRIEIHHGNMFKLKNSEYKFVGSNEINDLNWIFNKSFNEDYKFYWYSWNKDVNTMNKFKNGIKEILNRKISRLAKEVDKLRNLSDSIQFEEEENND